SGRRARLGPPDGGLEPRGLAERPALLEEQPRLVLGEDAPRRTQPRDELGEGHCGHHTARRTRTRASSSSDESGVPSARRAASAREAACAGTRPSAVTTRHHGTEPPHRAMTVPTWRGPPRAVRPRAARGAATTSATGPSVITRPSGICRTPASTASTYSSSPPARTRAPLTRGARARAHGRHRAPSASRRAPPRRPPSGSRLSARRRP